MLFFIAMFSCEDISGPYYYRVISTENALQGITADEVENVIKQLLPTNQGAESFCAEISIVRYFSGKEIYSFSGSEEEGVVVSHGDVSLEVMVRIKKQERTLKVFFVKAEAKDKNNAIRDMVKKLGRELKVKN